uniref:Uncharacterized protein n=1 Tax=Kalanchoe fedtschenkoi TaxID=63787 RepID=A0A7N0V2B0_KALFE
MEAVVVEDDRARVLVGGGGRSKEAEHKDAQLKFVALGGMTMSGVIAWMKVAEQWRAWVFLLLNLLLLAILLSSGKSGGGDHKHADKKEEATSTRLTAVPATTPKCDASEAETECRGGSLKVNDNEEDWEEDGVARRGCFEGDEEDDELNERAEAFILKFRQHLLADARSTGRAQQHRHQHSSV